MLQAAYSANGFSNNGSAPNEWYLDSGASSHFTGNPGNLDLSNPSLKPRFTSIVVGNGTHLPIQATGSATLPPHNFHLRDVLFSPHAVTSLISVRQFTKDNSCSIEFFPLGFVVKDLRTRRVIMISASSGDLYPFFGNNKPWSTALSATTSTADVWHRRLGHPSP
uniref:Retrovirus-related Pol polyprotein from transposon TNT 1-94-like beta-barrel domain-containing protein n=1 Tax=Triticum urartu TaxID=4572 RepID=A0A8R7K4I0_TRIUA